REPLGQRIDRFDQWQAGEPGFINDAVGMHHLQHAVIERRNAGDVAERALWQQLFDVVLTGVKEGQDDVTGVIARVDEIRRPRAAGRRRTVTVDRYRDGDDGTRDHVDQLWPSAAVHRAGRQMEYQVKHSRALLAAEQTAIELFYLRSDAW